jgi:octaprenyl-diphosphate synthase
MVEGRVKVDLLGDMPATRRRAVEAAVRRAARVSPAAPDLPRAGWLSALAHGVAWAYGRSVDRRALALGAVALEGANAYVFTGLTDPTGVDLASIARWMADRRVRGVTRTLRRERADWLRRSLDRLRLGRVGDDPIPEAVLSVRAAVLVGGLCGDVSADVMAQLDRVATGLGLLWEDAMGTLDAAGRRGAWKALGGEPEELRASIRRLPDSGFAEELEAMADRLERVVQRRPVAMARAFVGFRPMATSGPRPAHGWLDVAMQALLGTDPMAFVHASDALRARGGKRLRPQLVVAAYRVCSGDVAAPPPPAVQTAAAAVEWLHTASLILDDVLDASDMRRGGLSLHIATSTPFALAVFLWLLDRVRLATEALGPDAARVVSTAAERLADGQVEELAHIGDHAVSRTVCQRIVASKTSALFEAAVQLGALCAEATEAERAALRAYGRALGQAFQLADDVMDVTARSEVLGKHPGADLKSGKPTLPWVLAREQSSAADVRARLDAALGAPDPSWALSFLREHAGVRQALTAAGSQRDAAIAALSDLPSGSARDALVAIAHAAVDRAVVRGNTP